MFDIYSKDGVQKPVPGAGVNPDREKWMSRMIRDGLDQKAEVAKQHFLTHHDNLVVAQSVFEDLRVRAEKEGVVLTQADFGVLLNELVGLGKLTGLIASNDVEDISINLGHIYAFTTSAGWKDVGPAGGEVSALRVELSRHGKQAPTYESPIADAMLSVQVYTEEGPALRNVRINYIGEPASPYGDLVTLRVSRRPPESEANSDPLEDLCSKRLPPVSKPSFEPKSYSNKGGVFSSGAANYLISVLVHGGTLVLAGATGTGKTYVARSLFQAMLNHFPKGAVRLFVVEDSQEIVLNGWDGDPAHDTGNVLYTVTRPETIQGPPPITMYDLVTAALRQRPHGLVIGEARGSEAWELVRAASTGHGYSAFTIHATDIDTVWPRFLQVARAHRDATGMLNSQIAQGFAQAVNAIVFLERNPVEGQIATHVSEVVEDVDPNVGIPVLRHLFEFDHNDGLLKATGTAPMRSGYNCNSLNLPPNLFARS